MMESQLPCVRYSTHPVDEAVSLAKACGKGMLMTKLDLKSTYWMILNIQVCPNSSSVCSKVFIFFVKTLINKGKS